MKLIVTLVVAVILAGCGGEYKVTGEVGHRFYVDPSELHKYFKAYCLEHEPDRIAEECADSYVGEFLADTLNPGNGPKK